MDKVSMKDLGPSARKNREQAEDAAALRARGDGYARRALHRDYNFLFRCTMPEKSLIIKMQELLEAKTPGQVSMNDVLVQGVYALAEKLGVPKE